MLDVEGFILVGGASSRMGADKSQLVFDGQTTIELIAEALRSLTTQVRLVGSRDESIKNAFPNLPDLHPSWGPLGGIHTALNACKAEWAAIVACDLPLVTGELFNRLSKFIDESEPRTCDAVVPIQIDARPQPLCALYRKDACLVATEQLIANGEHTPRALLEKVRARFVDFSELSDLDGSEHFFFNVNTPEHYERAKQIAAANQSAH